MLKPKSAAPETGTALLEKMALTYAVASFCSLGLLGALLALRGRRLPKVPLVILPFLDFLSPFPINSFD
ncbi:hypothetical protein ACSX1A_14955 [Pontibacter sp. MBLB2868]|uniref:hypothetical protein n=1 Tax=Pontibacter sp. MBLB2868 TaxID=3451555 RepID=UPI003F754152